MDKNIFYYLLNALDTAKENDECIDYEIDMDKHKIYADFFKEILEINSLSSFNEGDNRYRYAVSDILSDYGFNITPKNITVSYVDDSTVSVTLNLV